MHEHDSDQNLGREIRRELDRSCERLDSATLSRLNRIRHAALDTSSQSGSQWRAFAGSALFTALLVVIVSFYIRRDETAASEAVAISELEAMDVLSADESLEFYEDFEFYEWLSMNEDL